MGIASIKKRQTFINVPSGEKSESECEYFKRQDGESGFHFSK